MSDKDDDMNSSVTQKLVDEIGNAIVRSRDLSLVDQAVVLKDLAEAMCSIQVGSAQRVRAEVEALRARRGW